MRWIYNVQLSSGKGATVSSLERIHAPERYFRERFGEDSVLSVTERHGDGDAVLSPKERIKAAIGEFYQNQKRGG